MRVRSAVLCAVLLLGVMSPSTAHAGIWSTFVAWMSDLDPKSGGIGIEVRVFCPTLTGDLRFTCDDPNSKTVIKTSAAVLLGTLTENGGAIFVLPVLGSVERDVNSYFSFGGGAGVIHVGGTLVGAVTRPLIQAQATLRIPNVDIGIRPEVNLIPKGFPAGAFAAGAPSTGTEVVPGVSVVFSIK